MSLFPRMTPFHHPSRKTHQDDLVPFFSLFNDTFNELQRLSDNLPSSKGGSGGFFAPNFDVKETPQAYELQGELPGIAQKDITIEFVDENTLTVKGHTEHRREQSNEPTSGQEQQQVNNSDKAFNDNSKSSSTDLTTTSGANNQQLSKPQTSHTYWVSERSVGSFSRSFSFPNQVDREHVKASLKHGILSIVVPKMTKPQPTTRQIAIQAEE
ncbi:uncharacterized protein HMPREF1541_06201 [Cyphellophora europaea CBS 101466]|uniref:SHSP domain-containing protein n=1 Tax=Cyphellophora europaea (strain CBS 101466) TaxID=1220924 RepID=W2RWB6_CYPE1|nr:uncharacterized protein HMPREF1541_06201 [Cyphellophora europaea CBS 101466]ETN39974.1 hypothetical protein HMPREF1541_06201 [Cyphellophora europaea CBS 101466]